MFANGRLSSTAMFALTVLAEGAVWPVALAPLSTGKFSEHPLVKPIIQLASNAYFKIFIFNL